MVEEATHMPVENQFCDAPLTQKKAPFNGAFQFGENVN
jgi:hypothetical protein